MVFLIEKFIVLHLRDDNYIREDFKSGLKEANTNKYIKAIQYALSQNYKVIRVGKIRKIKSKLIIKTLSIIHSQNTKMTLWTCFWFTNAV